MHRISAGILFIIMMMIMAYTLYSIK